jgi:hypothetical protein
MNYPVFLIANTLHGVYRVSAIDFVIDYPQLAPTKPAYFLAGLDTLDDDEFLSTVIHGDDEDIYNQIANLYEIK